MARERPCLPNLSSLVIVHPEKTNDISPLDYLILTLTELAKQPKDQSNPPPRMLNLPKNGK